MPERELPLRYVYETHDWILEIRGRREPTPAELSSWARLVVSLLVLPPEPAPAAEDDA
jgi:hypothetical protein